MDIAALSTAMAQQQVATQVGISVFNMAKESATQAGEQIVNMMNSVAMANSVNPNLGGNIDIKL